MNLLNDPTKGAKRPQKSARRAWMPTWLAVALVLAATYALVLVPGIEPREWAAEIAFITAHLVAAEVIISGHRRR